MENNQTLLKEKLGFFGILKEAVKIPSKNLNFIIFTFLTSLPLLCSLLVYESMFMQTLIGAAKVLQEDAEAEINCMFCHGWNWIHWRQVIDVDHLIRKVSQKLVILVLSHLGILHLCDLFITVATVNSASVIHAGDKDLTLKEMFTQHLMDSRLKGPLITSIYAMLLASGSSVGLFSLMLYIYMVGSSSLFMMLFLAMFVALLRQYLEWLAVWDMGTVISVLEEKEGDVALVISASLSRGNRGSGILLMIGFLLWRLSLRLVCLFVAWNGGGSKILMLVVQVVLAGLANVFKWVCFVVYYVDCKRRRSKKELSVETGEGILSA